MIVSGFLLKGNAVRVCTISGTRAKHALIAEKFNKLELTKNPTQEDVKVFTQAFRAYCSDNSIDLICINKRNETGDRSGGAAGFRIEGIIMALSPVPISMHHPATIAATERKDSALKTKRPKTIDLGKAYDLAFECLE
jgi:hypothetical protein